MELGNLVFGNSRGSFPIKRGNGWEEELYRLFHAYAPNRDNSWRENGENFENDTFSVFRYYWGDCTCGYEKAEWQWDKSHSHAEGCYQTEYRTLPTSKRGYGKDDVAVKALCLKHHIPWNKGAGSAVHCTCSYELEWAAWFSVNKHSSNCPVIKPNFHFKPSDFQIQWYKYPLRDSYMNQNINLASFKSIIDACILSLQS